ncbi:sulfite exporter TauE/SafE family protein [Solimonas marina]|uniref:Probable membrane transporter protein n=1 Tax=Solimonas marina TaxID=2714601 RepID=A0A970B4F6_9GAMM|nr:sulfite exporter TauE/SafE family protein [Solimonas marina]
MTFDWLNVVAGFGVGVLVGLTGVGGGALMTPIMLLLFGVAPTTAVGTDLWFAAITKMVGGWVHGKRGTVDWRVLRLMFLGSLPLAVLTLIWLHYSGNGQTHNVMITRMLGGVLVLTSLASVFRPAFHRVGTRLRDERPVMFKTLQPAATVLAGAILGFLVTFTSIGAGALGAVMLLYLYPRRMKPSVLVGTDIVHAIPLTLIAGTGHLLLGNVNFSLLGMLLVGSIPGIVLGSLASSRAPEKLIRTLISVILTAVGVKMLWF